MTCLTAQMTQGGTNCFVSPSLLHFGFDPYYFVMSLYNTADRTQLHEVVENSSDLGRGTIELRRSVRRYITAACSFGLPH